MIRYAGSTDCRMASLVRHFGDRTDQQKPAASAISALLPTVWGRSFALQMLKNAPSSPPY